MSYRRYSGITLTIVFLIIFLSFLAELFHFKLTPITGDLTRIGMHSEFDFGGTKTEYFFRPALSKMAEIDTIDDYDIIVIGDSFSTKNLDKAWHNFLQRDLGLSIGVFDITKYNLEDIVKSEVYKNNPPKILIYQSVERNLPSRSYSQSPCLSINGITTFKPLKPSPLDIKPQPALKNLDLSLQIDRGLRYLKKVLIPNKKTQILDLSTDELFTNNSSDRLLIFSEDIENKRHLLLSDWKKIRCGLLEYQDLVQSNHKTRFVALIAPDKLTAYSKFLKDYNASNLSRYDFLTADQRLNIVPLNLYFEEAHKKNQKDIYLPNDTHWSSSGNKLVGDAVLDYLTTNTEKN